MSVSGIARASRAHPGFVAALIHRLSGLALAAFLPMHFLVLGLALEAESFTGLIDWTNQPWVKISEALLVSTLSVHFAGGLRLLAVEFFGLTRAQSLWIALALAFGLGVGVLFLMKAF
ncbi:succinate dehydrogenase/Fumarate reductase transmembrane subunit [bacterium BMS3Bbin10]|nr:succinate dehydrogenase/Fumarate reductase transmembrane subunit [bacterium BMS3Bbin10]HDL16507.1 succinate dehydrogenase [Hyphomicrobiales bacterium]